MSFQYERETRTPQSECYVIEDQSGSRARVDLHYTPVLTFATLCVPESWGEDEITDLIQDIEERWGLSANLLSVETIVTVWRGQEVGVYQHSKEPNA